MSATKNPASEIIEKAQADFANMSESFRNMAEKSVAQSTEAYSQFKALGVTVLSSKALENAQVNAEAGVAFVDKVTKVKSFAEVLELQGEFFRTAFERLSSQAKEAQELALKVTEKAAAPVKASAEKATAAVSKEANKVIKAAKAA